MTDGWNYDEFLRYLRSAKLSISVDNRGDRFRKSFDACVFTITDNRVAEVMEDLHARGIKVRLITDNDTAYADGSDIKRLFKAGIPVKVDKSPHHMHNKVWTNKNCQLMSIVCGLGWSSSVEWKLQLDCDCT
jgi:phosphatidylserine/phosphatidylglycerophosphate/cardiolipin synthase-like enzyme